jgi:MraZ protein
MNKTVYIGTYYHLLDDKNRFFLPAKLRKKTKNFIITSGIDKCLYIYSKDIWEKIINKFDNLQIFDKSKERAFKRMFLANAVEVENDNQGRIVLPNTLKLQANIKKEVVIIGVGNRLELWSKELWQKYYNKSKKIFEKLSRKLEF